MSSRARAARVFVVLVAAAWLVASGGADTPASAQSDADDAVGFGALGPSEPDETGESGNPESDANSGTDAESAASAGSANDEAGFGGLDEPSADSSASARRTHTTASLTLRADGAAWTERLGTGGFAKLRFIADPRSTTRYRELRVVVGVRAEADAAYLSPRVSYDQATIDTYAWVVRPQETFVAWDRPRGELAAGFQTVSWGHGEALTVVDLVNPRDLREPGLTAIEDARLPVLMTRGAVFGRGYRVEVVATHQAYYRLMPPPLGQWSPIRAALLEDPELVALGISDLLRTKDVSWAQSPAPFAVGSQSIAARVVLDHGPFTFGVYAGAILDPQGVARLPDAAALLADRVAIPLEHRRFGMLALSSSVTRGAFAAFSEIALDVQRPINVLSDSPIELLVDRRTLVRWLAGGRYTNARGGVLTLEYAQGTLHEIGRNQPDPLVPTSVATVVARYEHAFARDAFRFASAVAVTGKGLAGGGFGRAELAWVPIDGLRLAAGYAIYLPTDEPSAIRGFERHDRAMLSVRWDDSWSF